MNDGLQQRRVRHQAVSVLPDRPSRRRRGALHLAPEPELGDAPSDPRGSLVLASALLGIGLGGFVDCIVFHQMLPLHDLLRAHMPDAVHLHGPLNLLWDGIFHATTWLATALGLGLLWELTGRAESKQPTGLFLGGIALGWGLFNCAEGLRMFGLYDAVQSGPEVLGDSIFLASGAPLLAVGLLLIRLTSVERLRPRPPLVLSR